MVKSIACAFVGFLLAGAVSSAQAEEAKTLPLPQFGAIPDIPGAVNRPDPALTYKLVFDVEAYSPSSEVHPALKRIARYVNTFAQNGVPVQKRQWAVVIHGPATPMVMNDAAYAGRTGAASNPNTEVLKQLKAQGVEFHVCGQSTKGQNITREMMAPEVTVDLASSTSLFNFQTRGYILVPEL